ncbi:hypothetical protein [Shewanella baltica]|uniref:hypothetical protein n=1 Tax=Shewanella baltica TaxID=62322 RepID=UPI003D78E554
MNTEILTKISELILLRIQHDNNSVEIINNRIELLQKDSKNKGLLGKYKIYKETKLLIKTLKNYEAEKIKLNTIIKEIDNETDE